MVNERGITLIELMIVIALVAIISMAIFPLGRAWVANQQITKTEKAFLEAYTRAKNVAVLNPNAVTSDTATPAAVLIVDNNAKTITVRDKDDIDPTSVIILEAAIAPTVTVTLANACSNKIQLSNNASVMTAHCTSYTISANGGTNATGNL